MTSLAYYTEKGKEAAESAERPSRRSTYAVNSEAHTEDGWVFVARGDGVFEFSSETTHSEEITVPLTDGEAIELARWILRQTGASL